MSREGWRCPNCGAINAPWMPTCGCGGRMGYNTTIKVVESGPPLNDRRLPIKAAAMIDMNEALADFYNEVTAFLSKHYKWSQKMGREDYSTPVTGADLLRLQKAHERVKNE